MKLRDNRIDVRKVETTLDEADWKQILIEAVAVQAGITLGPGVTARAYVSTRDTSTGILHEIKVEVVEDYRAGL